MPIKHLNLRDVTNAQFESISDAARSCRHDWVLQPYWSDPAPDGVRRYQCSACGCWGRRYGARKDGQPEAQPYTIYGKMPLLHPSKNWRTILTSSYEGLNWWGEDRPAKNPRDIDTDLTEPNQTLAVDDYLAAIDYRHDNEE